MKQKVYFNGKVFTSDLDKLYASSFIVENGCIKWVGNSEELCDKMAEMPENIEKIDLEGKCVVPGFVDTHMHPIILANDMQKISCLPPNVYSIEELVEHIRKVAETKGENEWIQGWGYDEEKFSEHRGPTRWDLDKASKDKPIELLRSCSHIACVNSKALEIAGITKDTPDPEGGHIDRDENGEPTGVLRENAKYPVEAMIPNRTRQELVQSVVDLGQLLLSQGIVAITDMGNLENADFYEIYKEAEACGFKQELGIYYIWNLIRENPDFEWHEDRADRSAQIHMSGIKIVGDGSIGGRTAWTDRPYKGTTDQFGINTCTDEELESAIAFCKKHKCQLSYHGMGKRTIDRIMDRIKEEEPWITDVPFVRLEHVTDPSEKSIEIMAEKKVPVATQMIFLYSEIESYLNNLGLDWIKEIYPIKYMMEKGVKVALSTDAPATSWAIPSDPFPNIKCAVTRTAYDGTFCGKDNAIDIETAIRLYTVEAAEIAGFENLGMIKEGYKADFAILSEDIFTIDSERIDSVYVTNTFIGGEEVYTK